MFYLILSSILVILFYIPYGVFLTSNAKDLLGYSTQLIYSLIVLSFIALFSNFFLPLTISFNSILIIISLILIIKNYDQYLNKKFLFFVIICSSIIFLLIANSNTFRPDAGLYHFPYIKILNDEKIILGLSNLHFRFGHISIIQYLSAISNNFIFQFNGMVFPSAVIASAIIINFYYQIYLYIKNKKYNFHFFYLFFTSIFIIYKMNRYSEYGNDIPAHLLFFFLISETIKISKFIDIRRYVNLFILSVFILLNKITLGIACFIPLILINKKNLINIFKTKRTYFGISFLILWILKNILVSGCMFYPVSKTCFSGLEWTDLKTVEYVTNENEAWSKNWPDQKEITSHKEYNKNFNWLKSWTKNYSKKIVGLFLPFILLNFLVLIYLSYFEKNRKNYNNLSNNNKILILIFILSISTVLWFLKLPLYRYGTSFIVSLIAILFALVCAKKTSSNIYNYKLLNFLLILSLLIFVSKNSLRIVKNNYAYNNYPWPKFYSHGDKNILPEIKTKFVDNKKIYRASKGICMYSKSPCTGKKIDIKIKNIGNYLLFVR